MSNETLTGRALSLFASRLLAQVAAMEGRKEVIRRAAERRGAN